MFNEVNFSDSDELRKSAQEQFGLYNTYVRLHESLVAYYSSVLCQLYEIDPQKVGSAAIYHDHGKFLWDKSLMLKPFLSREDWRVIKRHPLDSIEIIRAYLPETAKRFSKGDPSVNDIIYLHHERPDGSGYYGIRDLPIEAVILSIADIFDSCLSDRPYRKAMSLDVAILEAFSPFEDFLIKKGYSPDAAKRVLAESVIPKPKIQLSS